MKAPRNLTLLAFLISSHAAHSSTELDVKFGSSSNPLQQVTPVSGSFLDLEASHLIRFDLSQSLGAYADVSLSARHYFSELLSDNGRFVQAAVQTGAQALLGKYLELGGDLGLADYRGRDLSLVSGDSAGRQNRSAAYRARIYSRQEVTSPWSIEESVEWNALNQRDATIDEGANIYRDSRSSRKFEIKLAYTGLALESFLSGAFQQNFYTERRARFTEGTLGPSLPLLEESQYQIKGKLKKRGGIVAYSLSPSYVFNKDRIKGAEDFHQTGLEVEIETKIFIVDAKAGASFSRSRYTNFVADVIANPLATEKRLDEMRLFFVEAARPLLNGSSAIKYSYQETKSKYPLAPNQEKLLELSWTKTF